MFNGWDGDFFGLSRTLAICIFLKSSPAPASAVKHSWFDTDVEIGG